MSAKQAVATKVATNSAHALINKAVENIAAKSSSPSSVAPTTSLIRKIPAFGIEIESVYFTLCGADATKDSTFQDPKYETKKKKLLFFTAGRKPDTELNNMAEGKSWAPTAEIQGGDLNRIQLEIIYGGDEGREITTAGKELAAVGRQIYDFLNTLDTRRMTVTSVPATVKNLAFMLPKNFESLATDAKHVGCGWINNGPSYQNLGVQATAPIPLAALSDLIKKMGFKKMIDVSPDQIKDSLAGIEWRDKSTKIYGEKSVSGLMIMIMSYVNVAAGSSSLQDMDLKKQTELMPRTDFQTMLKIVTDLMSDKSARLFSTSLWGIVEKLAKSRNIGERLNGYFNWGSKSSEETQKPSKEALKSNPFVSADALKNVKLQKPQDRQPSNKTPPPGKSVAPRQTEVPPSSLPVKKWLQDLATGKPDLIAAKEKEFRGAQLGALGNKVETLIGNDKFLCPILELRDIGGYTVADLKSEPNFMQKLLEKIEDCHKATYKI